jgi:hypothetical protein
VLVSAIVVERSSLVVIIILPGTGRHRVDPRTR